jgi:hypothetical protein
MCNSSRLKFGQQASAKRPGEAARIGEHGEHPLVEHPQVRRCPGHERDERSRYFLPFPFIERSITNRARGRARGGVAHALFEEIMKTVELACIMNSAACCNCSCLIQVSATFLATFRNKRKVARVRCETPPVRAVRIARREHENEGV